LRVSDMIGLEGLTAEDLIQYTYPSDEELARVGVTGLFMGHFMPWDSYTNAMVAQSRGFETYPTTVEGHFVNYENLDNCQAGIHEYLMFLKYGFGRATSQACMEIRRGRLTRELAVKLVADCEGKFPWSYLGKDLLDILGETGLSLEDFKGVCDRYTNKQIFITNNRGELIRDEALNLKKTNYDNA
jgi:hypothetical protein